MQTNIVTNITKKYLSSIGLSEEIIVNGEVSDIEYMSLSGGKLTGDITIDGNYIQTNSISGVYNFSGKNSYIQAESSKYGIACTGSKGYCILNANPTTKTVKLSGDISEIVSKLDEGTLTDFWSYSIWSSFGTSCFQIIEAEQTETSAGVISISPWPNGLNTGTKTEEECIEFYFNDDNGIYYPSDPTIGNCLIINAYGNHAEGQSTKALGRQTHAEGRGSTADIRYSHAEGTFTYAGGMASHAEGYGAAGDVKNKVMAMGTGSHAEGWFTKTFSNGSHSEGCCSISYRQGSHVEGGNTDHNLANIAFGDYSHAEGEGRSYAGTRYFVVTSCDTNLNTITLQTVDGLYEKCDLVGGSNSGMSLSSITGWKVLDIDSETNTISVNYIPENINAGAWISVPSDPKLGDPIDFSNIQQSHIRGNAAHAEGKQNYAIGPGSHAEGYRNITIGDYSHADGSWNKTGLRAHASGRGNGAYAEGSIAMGYSGQDAYDTNTLNYAIKSFAWSGNGKYTIPEDKSGTFNINPVGGTAGFYIGDTSLDKYLSDSASNVLSGKQFKLSNASGDDLLSILSSIITALGGKVQ